MSQPTAQTSEELGRSIKSSANWCFWIAALTAVNAVTAMTGSGYGFVLGAVIAQVAMQLAADANNALVQGLALAFNVFLVGFFVGFGVLARGGRRWAFAIAFLAYGADTLLLLLDPALLPIFFHGWALFALARGFIAVAPWRRALAAERANNPPTLAEAFAAPAKQDEDSRLDRFARETEEMMTRLYAPKHERRLVNPQDFKVDHGFYERATEWLETRGFRQLGDYELADLKGTPQDPGCFLRALASDDGMVSVALFHMQPATWWLRLLMLALSRGGLKCVDFQTEFSDGSFVCTSNTKLAATTKLPSQIDACYLEPKTPLEELHRLHLERVARFLERRADVTVRPVRTLEDAFAAESRQDVLKAVFRQQVGGMSREELFAQADSPAKQEAAEKLWARMQERKTAGAARGAADPAGGAK